jgi:hypothetical protein
MRYDALGAVSSSAASRYGVFTRKQAASEGLNYRAIARLAAGGAVIEPIPGVLVLTSVTPSWEQRLAVACAARNGLGMASFRSSGRLHWLDGLQSTDLIEISSTKRLAVTGALVHQVTALDRCDRTTINGIPTTSLARTLCDLASVLSTDELERALDSARRWGISLRWLRETAERLHRPGQRGTNAIFAQLAAIDPSREVRGSWFERVVEAMLADPRIPPLVRQFEVLNDMEEVVARPDLAIPSIKLAIEAHSREFHFGRAAESSDEDRDNALAHLGWDTRYLGYQSTRRPEATADQVAAVVATRAAQLGVDLGSSL